MSGKVTGFFDKAKSGFSKLKQAFGAKAGAVSGQTGTYFANGTTASDAGVRIVNSSRTGYGNFSNLNAFPVSGLEPMRRAFEARVAANVTPQGQPVAPVRGLDYGSFDPRAYSSFNKPKEYFSSFDPKNYSSFNVYRHETVGGVTPTPVTQNATLNSLLKNPTTPVVLGVPQPAAAPTPRPVAPLGNLDPRAYFGSRAHLDPFRTDGRQVGTRTTNRAYSFKQFVK